MRLCDGLHTAARSKNHHPRHRHANPPPLPPPHRPYWFNRHNRVAWALLAADTACTLILILIGVWIVQWDKRFYDALHDMNGAVLPALVIEYLGYLGLVVAWMNAGEWLRKRLIIHWREHMSEQFQRAWLAEHKH